MLYVTSGDGTSDSDTNIVGQDLSKLPAKVLRIDVDHPDPGKAYSVPKDNPFVGQKDVRPETWAYGLRNPWRMTVDEKTGHVWVGNNGQDLWEQAYFVEKGDNYGWSVMEGSHPFYPNRKAGPTPFTKPTVEHPHSEARSLTGGIVYYGTKHPGPAGRLHLRRLLDRQDLGRPARRQAASPGTRNLPDTRLQITGFGADSHGEILIADHRGQGQGRLLHARTDAEEAAALDVPTQAERKRPFSLRQGARDGAGSDSLLRQRAALVRRRLQGALDRPAGRRLAASTSPPSAAGTFPDETVLVKSFALEMEEGNPASRRWIETRFLTNQQGEWFGYSYLWNDEQTDGVLVDAKGLDREFSIRVKTMAAFASRPGTTPAAPSAWSATAGPPTSCSA